MTEKSIFLQKGKGNHEKKEPLWNTEKVADTWIPNQTLH